MRVDTEGSETSVPRPLCSVASSLAALRADLCQAAIRPSLFREKPDVIHAISRLMLRVIEYRCSENLATFSDEVDRLRTALKDEGFPDDYRDTALRKFEVEGIIGTRRRTEWMKSGPRILRKLLLTPEERNASHEASTIAESIVGFFFPDGYAELPAEPRIARAWYFDPRLWRTGYPATTDEAVQELQRMTFHCENRGARATIVRTSGSRRLFVLRPDQTDVLNPTGERTIELIASGGRVFHVIPDDRPEDDCTRYAVIFEQIARERLGDEVVDERVETVRIPADAVRRDIKGSPARFPGEYLSPRNRYTYHRCEPGDGVAREEGQHGWRMLLACRNSRNETSFLESDQHDLDLFESWFECFTGRNL